MEFKIESKRSPLIIILTLIAPIIFALIINKVIGFVIAAILFITGNYIYFTARSILIVSGNQLIIEITKGIPAKKTVYSYNIREIKQIDIIQTHYGRGDRRHIVVHSKLPATKIDLNFRYYQLVKIQDFFNKELKIKTILKG